MTKSMARQRVWRWVIVGSAASLLIVLALILCLVWLMTPPSLVADLPKTIKSAACTKAPTIDGVLGEDEWKEATTITFDMPMVQLKPLAVKDKRKCELRVMNSANNLYIALRVPNAVKHESLDPLDLDIASLAFCQGKDVAKGDDRKLIFATGQYVDKHVVEPGKDEDDPQQDGQGAVAYAKGYYTFEWAVPLGSQDADDLRAKPGDEFRFNIAFLDGFRADLKGTIAGGLFGPDLDHAKDWGKLRLAADVKEEAVTPVKIPKLVELPPSRGSGPGAWPVQGALYEVCLENYPNHSLKELTADIPRLKKLGITALYLTPIFRCLGKAQYLISDYDAINPRYGTEEDLQAIVKTAHKHDIKVLLDLVTSIVYDGTDIVKKHPDWVLRGKDGRKQKYYPIPEFGWALDCTHPEVIDYFSGVAKRYVEKYGIDGWRIDSPTNNYDPAKVEGDHSRVQLLRAVRKAVDAVKKDAIFVAEVSGPMVLFGGKKASLEPLFDEMLEASYDMRFCGFLSDIGYRAIDGMPLAENLSPTPLDALAQNKLTSKEFVELVTKRRILNGRLRANFIENHDTDRVSKVFPKQHRSLFVMIATIPGIPVVHCGQEIGSTVHPDVAGKVAVVDWEHGDKVLQDFYERVLKARAGHAALVRGDMRDIWVRGDKCIAYLRTAADDRVLVALNFDAKPAKSVVRVAFDGKMDRTLTLVDEITGEKTQKMVGEVEALEVALEPYGYRIISIR